MKAYIVTEAKLMEQEKRKNKKKNAIKCKSMNAKKILLTCDLVTYFSKVFKFFFLFIFYKFHISAFFKIYPGLED